MSETTLRYPGESDEAYPEVFTIPPTQPSEKKPGQLTKAQLQRFYTEGYVVLEKFFLKTELDPVKEAINKMVDNLAKKLYNAGKVSELYEEYGFYERLIHLEKDFPGANIILHKVGAVPQAIKDLLCNERILNAMEQIVGPDIAASPVWNLRTKTPNNEATNAPWHQDASYFDKEGYKVMIATAWIPFLDANENNGCMQYVRRGHQSGRVATHQCCSGNTWYTMLEDDEMEKTLGVNMKTDVVTTLVPYGGLILFSNMIPHRSLNNSSHQVRWSVDLRWQSPHLPYGHFGIKDGIVLRKASDPSYKPDWTTFDNVHRVQAGLALLKKDMEEFDTTIQGPWMQQWQIVHMNRHTEAFHPVVA